MLSESEKRAAQLAVSRYGVDRAKIQQAIHTVLEERAKGKGTDFFDHLLSVNLLSPPQVQDLRLALDLTQVDPNSPKNRPAVPEEAKTQVPSQPNGYPEDLSELRCLGEFRILRRLGEGGMGSVFLGYQETEGRQVAIKVLTPQMATSQTSVDRFYREAHSGKALNHPNIVRNLAVALDPVTGYHYMVLEYVDGPSAQGLLESLGKLVVSDAVHIILDIARALEHVHSRNIVHRDIKPANILITQSGVAKLADLGLAKRTDEASHLTAARQGFGTPFYMPYEQALNAKKADGRADIYALGATLYHLVTGTVPFPGNNHLEIVEKKNLGFFTPASVVNSDIPPALDRILQKMLARHPEDRYQTASELIVDLERANLAAAVPSFVDPDRAMQDPLVRQRLTLAAQPTSLAVNVHPAPGVAISTGDPSQVWFVRFPDDKGKWCKVKGTLAQIQQRLRDGKLPLSCEVSLAAKGDYQPIALVPEFKETVALLGPSTSAKTKDKEARLETTAEFVDPYRPENQREPEAEVPTPRWVFWGLAAGIALLVTTVIMRLFIFPH